MELGSSLSIVRQAYSGGPSGPTNTVAPVISGTATVGETLSCTTGTWSGEGTITYAYQWLDDGAAISGATSSTYALTSGEEGGNITCRVTATDDNGSTPATSNSLGPVAAATGAPLSLSFETDTYSDGTNTAFGDIFTFSRSGSATYVDSSGIIQTASTGVARRNHHEWNGTSWVNKGLLLETDSATNLFKNSTDLSVAGSNGLTDVAAVRTSNVTGPDGVENSAITLIESATNSVHSAYSEYNTVHGATYTVCVWAKAGSRTVFRLAHTTAGNADGYYADFDLSSGAVLNTGNYGTGTYMRSGIIDFNGWYFAWITGNTPGTNTFVPMMLRDDTINHASGALCAYAGDGSSGLSFYGLQLTATEYPSSYIPTSGSTVTRATEANDIKAASMPFSATAMSGVMIRELTYADNDSTTEQTLFDWRADANNRITVTLDTAGANTGKVTLTVVNSGSSVSITTTGQLTPGYSVSAKVGWRVTTSEVNIALNGTAETAVSNTAGIPTLSSADAALGDSARLAEEYVWDSDIGDAQLETETA